MRVLVQFLHENATMPTAAHDDDYGYDVRCVSVERVGFLTYRYHTGLAFQIEADARTKACITARPKSGIWKTGLILMNAPGTVDKGYNGEVTFVFFHLCFWRKKYKVGDKCGQIHLDLAPYANFFRTDLVKGGARGTGREGSTGK